MTGQDGNIVLCGSNSYEKKYYFNEEFNSLPEAVKKQLHVMCVWFTEECGGILTMEFEPDGTLEFKHTISEYDGYCDEIGADLKIKQYRQEGQEFLKALELYFKVFYLGEDAEEVAESYGIDTEAFKADFAEDHSEAGETYEPEGYSEMDGIYPADLDDTGEGPEE